MISYKLLSYTDRGDLMMKALIDESKRFLKHFSSFLCADTANTAFMLLA